MKSFKIILASLMFVLATPAFAQSLHDQMEQIGRLFKAINIAAKDPAQNAQSAVNAGKLEALFTASLNEIPDALINMPSDIFEKARAKYQEMIRKEIELSHELQLAFQANDNAQALKILATMNQLKKDGHSQFD